MHTVSRRPPAFPFGALGGFFRSVASALVVGGIAAICTFTGCYYPSHTGGGGGRASTTNQLQPRWPERDPALTIERLMHVQADLIATAAEMAAPANGSIDHSVSAGSAADSPWIIEPTRQGAVVRIVNRETDCPVENDHDNLNLTIAFSNIWLGFYPNAFFHTSESTAPLTRQAGHQPLQQLEQARFSVESGIPLRLPTSIPHNPRGLLVHYTALTGSDYERTVVQRFADEGWIVIDISTRINVRAPDVINIPARAVIPRRPITMAALTEQPRRGGGTWYVDQTTDTIELGQRIARVVDIAIAENSLAGEAAIEVVQRRFPMTRELDVAYIGFSAGALVGPATVERLRLTVGDRLKAAIFIGGGGDAFSIADRSSTSIRSMRLHWNVNPAHSNRNDEAQDTTPEVTRLRRPPPHITYSVGRSYIRHATLDPLNAIARLEGVRILLIDAAFDAVVLPSSANRLAAAAPKNTQRWRFIGGHYGLFGYLPSQAPNLTRWLERAMNDGHARITHNAQENGSR